jgi:spoIIIJ-associated protein
VSEDQNDVVEPAEDAAAGEGTRSKKETVLESEGEIAADYLEELLDIADLDGDIDTYAEGGRAHVSILTEGDVLVGKDGEVLEALQELARLAVMTETGHRSRLIVHDSVAAAGLVSESEGEEPHRRVVVLPKS